MYKSLETTLYAIRDKITLIGRTRFGDDAALRLSWSASGFMMRFVGEAIALTPLTYFSAADPSANPNESCIAVKLEIDGVAHKACVSNPTDVIFADGLSEGEHTLRLLKLTESNEPLRLDGVQIFGVEPRVLECRPKYSFRMEVVGDSITCGYGAWGTRPAFIHFEEDPTAAYAHLAAEQLCAELRLISWSGRGLYRSCDGEAANRFCDFFCRAERREEDGAHDFSEWTPDILVVNGGTNDANSGQVGFDEFEIAAEKFYNLIRSVYPRAKILFFYGAMGDYYDGVYRRLIERLRREDGEVYYLPTSAIEPALGELGAIGHPSAKCHKRLAAELAKAIREIM